MNESRLLGRTGPALVLVSVLAAIGCASALKRPDAADAAWAQQKWSSASLESLNEGRQRYVEKCAGCHELHHPTERSEAQWGKVVEEMQTEQDVALTPNEAEQIYQYLVTAGRDAH